VGRCLLSGGGGLVACLVRSGNFDARGSATVLPLPTRDGADLDNPAYWA